MIRVVPSLLALDGNIVKGRNASNDRVIGTIDSALRVQTARNVDEVTLIDVGEGNSVGKLSSYVLRASSFLRIPFTAGGGVSSLDEMGELLSLGADKVLVGRKFFGQKGQIKKASGTFGAQAILGCIEVVGSKGDWSVANLPPSINLGVSDFARYLQDEGAGEVLVFNRTLDGLRTGVAEDLASDVASILSVPTSYLGGVATPDDTVKLANVGISGIGIGSLFAFTRYTPNDVKRALVAGGFEVRL